MKGKMICQDLIRYYSEQYQKVIQNKILSDAIIKNGLNNTALNHDAMIEMQHTFSEEIATGKITDQKRTGRCWLFAGLNTMRYAISRNLGLELSKENCFQLSQAYLMFWDKLEKANYFLESIIETRNEKISSRLVMWLLENPMKDGGQWDMFANLINKYGVVPRYIMPESFHSSDSSLMDNILNLKLKQYAKLIREDFQNSRNDVLRNKKKEMIGEFYQILCHFLGEPKGFFDFEYKDKKKKFHRIRNLTPIKFYSDYCPINVNDFVSLINAPTNDKPFNQVYTVKYLGNIQEGRKILYLNLENERLKDLTINQLKDGEPVWFGCDVRQMLGRKDGIMDPNLYQYEEVLGTKLQFSKADRLDYGDSLLTHAMVFTGVNLLEDQPKRWKVENSWGDENGHEGYFIMSDPWFDQFLYQVVIQKKYLSKTELSILENSPIELEPWDPMGSLAL